MMTRFLLAATLGTGAMIGTAALAVAQTAPAPAPATPPPHARHGGGPMMQADANKDGVITRAEMLAAAEARFAKLDANRDGRIDAAEREAMRGKMKMHRRAHRAPPATEGVQ